MKKKKPQSLYDKVDSSMASVANAEFIAYKILTTKVTLAQVRKMIKELSTARDTLLEVLEDIESRNEKI